MENSDHMRNAIILPDMSIAYTESELANSIKILDSSSKQESIMAFNRDIKRSLSCLRTHILFCEETYQYGSKKDSDYFEYIYIYR